MPDHSCSSSSQAPTNVGVSGIRPLRTMVPGGDRARNSTAKSTVGTVLRFIVLGVLSGCSPTNPVLDAADALAPETSVDASSDAVSDVPVVDVPAPTPVSAMTQTGPLQGSVRNGINTFLNIPYAAAPVGSLRWKPPTAPSAWTVPLDATRPATGCPQRADTFGGTPESLNEDCLRLNVWTPQLTPSTPQPVMVFIHGGGFTSGTGAAPLFDGANLAARGVVAVTINYRLGQLGFLAHPGLRDEDTTTHLAGNYGLMDQQFALRWVKDNISRFGGDPNNVTLFGESAGSVSVCAHMASPLSAGLFHKAIQESGSCKLLFTPLQRTGTTGPESAVELGGRFEQSVGCSTGTPAEKIACMRGKSVDQVLSAVPTPFELTIRARFQPNIDGVVLTTLPWNQVRMGTLPNKVPLLQGVNRDEGTAFALITQATTAAQFQAKVEEIAPGHGAEAVALYGVTDTNVNAKWIEFLGDFLFNCPAREQSKLMATANVRTRLYQFVKENGFARVLRLGVFHSAELPYVFGNFTRPFTLGDTDLPVSMSTINLWTTFAKTGDPNPMGATTWPEHNGTTDTYLSIGDTLATGTALRRAQCDVLDPWVLFQ